VADISRALGNKILPYCDDLMALLLENLSNNNVHRSVKPTILSVFGDIALAIGPEFKKYLDIVLTTLMQASQIAPDKNDYDSVDYVNELRENCLESYTGIVQGLKGDKEGAANPDIFLINNHVQYMIQFSMIVAADPEINDGLIAACSGLIGDLTSAFGASILPLVDNDLITQMLMKGKRSKITKTRTLAIWTIKEIKKIKMNATPGIFPAQNHAQGILAQVPEDS